MERIAKGVKKNDYAGLGLCDKGVMFGVPSFIKIAEEIKKPWVIGLEASINDDTLCLYALNEEGYRHLINISTAIQKEVLDWKTLQDNASGLVAVLETINGKFKERRFQPLLA